MLVADDDAEVLFDRHLAFEHPICRHLVALHKQTEV